MSQRAKLSVHESAHACLRILLGGDNALEYVTVNADNPHARPTRVLADADEHVVTVAGIVAEFAFYPEESKVGHFGGDDLERVAAWSKEDERAAITRAKELVRKHSAAICKVADELLATGTVTGARVKEIVGG
jgi:ATP-dependent Zn protease